MRYILLIAILLVLSTFPLASTPPATQPPATTAPGIDQLIADLGSAEYQRRAAAQQALIDTGQAAVPALQAAAADPDLERSARAKSAIAQIRRDIATLNTFAGRPPDAPVDLPALLKLKSLNLAFTKLSDADLVHLKKLPNLESLTLP